MRSVVLAGSALPLMLLAACGGSGGGLVSTPAPPPSPAPTPAPTPTPTPTGTIFDTGEYRRSNAAVQAQALAAYQAGATGQGITAAVIDSGIDLNSAEFAGKIAGGSADLAASRGLQDPDGHGTAVASILLGAKNDGGAHGVAFNARLLVARTDTPGSCAQSQGPDGGCTHSDNTIARGVDLAIQSGARVINMSLGGSPPNATLRAAIGRATAAGIIIVISAGNDGVENPAIAGNPDPFAQVATDPLARGLVLIAGATTANQALADFSNRAGSFQQFYVTALGERVRAPGNDGTAFLWSGTSFAAPVVSGAVALLAQAFPNLSSAQIVDLLLRTTTDLGTPGADSTFGRGELNLARAFAPQGSSTLQGSRTPVSLTENGSLSAPMGDAAQAGRLVAAIRDGYDRAYQVDLAPTLARAPREARLAGALEQRGVHRSAALGTATTLALTVAPASQERLLLTRDELRSARALAASVTQRLSPRTQLALGFAAGSAGLDRALASHGTPAFLVADEGGSLGRAPQAAFAVRHRLGGIDVTLGAESGVLRLWQRGLTGPRSAGYRDHRYGSITLGADAGAGPLSLAVRMTRMTERDTVLGARFGAALGGGGATSWFADLAARAEPGDGWLLAANLRRGWTQVAGGAVRRGSTITSQAFSLDVTRSGVLTGDDSVALRWAEPLSVTDGGLSLTGLDGATLLALAPIGRARELEGVYALPAGPGWLTLNGFWRQDPGNIAAAPDDLGGAVRYRVAF